MKLSHGISVILLAGGKGLRINSTLPKQYLLLENKPVARYSFEVFLSLPEVKEIIIVCEPQYQHIFAADAGMPIKFALPGLLRQDSVYHGLQKASSDTNFICVHDSARPFIDQALVQRAIAAASEVGAAAVGMPVKFTVKECTSEQNLVQKTLDRSLIWEVQTPQVIRADWLLTAFNYIHQNNLSVTDDVSLVELLGLPVKLVEGSHTNIKITTPDDFIIAEHFIENFSSSTEYAKL